MFLIDNILLAPASGLLMIFRELHEAAQQEYANEAENIRTQLSELYQLLETSQLSEQEFDERETTLLDRLDVLEARNEVEEDEDEDEEEAEDEESVAEDESDVEVGSLADE